MIYSDAGRQGADHALHGVFMITVANVQIVMDVVLCDGEIAGRIVDSIITKMVNLVV